MFCLFPALNTAHEGNDVWQSVSAPTGIPEQALRDFCIRHDIRLSSLLRVAWFIILSSYTGSDKPLFFYTDGTTTQHDDRLKRRTLLCRSMSEESSVLELLQADSERELNEIDYQCPGICNTAINWGCEIESSKKILDEKNLGVMIDASTNQEYFHIVFWYRVALISNDQAIHVMDCLMHVMSQLTHVTMLESVQLFSEKSYMQLQEWSPGSIDDGENEAHLIHDLILEQCQSRPEALAVCAWDGNFTYRDLEWESKQVSQRLIDRGVGPGAYVGLYFEKSKWTTVAVLAILRSGAAYVFLDVSFPADRLKKICNQVNISMILCPKNLIEQAVELERSLLPIDGGICENSLGEDCNAGNVYTGMATQKKSSIAYVSFSSGSTGEPKGSLVPHSSYTYGQKRFTNFVGLTSSSRLFQFSSYGFDQVNYEHLSPLMVGACICVPSEEDRRNDIPKSMKKLGANTLSLTPTVARHLRPSDFPTLDTLLLQGEPLSLDDMSWTYQCTVINGFGPSECSGYTTAHYFRRGDKHPAIIGRGIGSKCWVVEPTNFQRLMPIGAIGELVIEGPTVGNGYIGNETKTNECFIEPPRWRSKFPGKPPRTLYLTGDLVQYVSGGELRYLGRKFGEAKLRGQRLELPEVEYHVRQAFGDNASVIAELVIPKRSPKDSKILAAFIKPQAPINGDDHSENTMPDGNETLFAPPRSSFREKAEKALVHIEKALPSFMVPSVIIELAIFPTTRTGKTDRTRLRREASLLSRGELEDYVRTRGKQRAPETEKELLLHGLIRQVLCLNEFEMSDNFFRLGGDSILAMELTSVSREAGFDLLSQTIFRTPILFEMARSMTPCTLEDEIPPFSILPQHLDRAQVFHVAKTSCGLASSDEIEDIYPCTPLQEGLMAASLAGRRRNYQISTAYRLSRFIDLNRLREAWTMVVSGSPILRTRIIHAAFDRSLQVVTLTPMEWEEHQSIEEVALAAASDEMTLGKPLLRLKLAVNEHTRHLMVIIHHALCDGWSYPQMLSDVEQAYYGGYKPLIPFKHFVKYVEGLDDKKNDDFWRAELEDYDGYIFPSLPADNKRGQEGKTKNLSRSIKIEAPKRSATTMATLLKLAWALTQSQYSGSNDVVFGCTVAGRSIPLSKVEKINGPTFATIPLRIKLDPDAKIIEMLQDLQHHSARCMPFEQAGLQRISSLGSGAAAACKFQTLFIVQPGQVDEPSTIFSLLDKSYSDEIMDQYALVIEAKTVKNGDLTIQFQYDGKVVTMEFAQAVMDQFIHLISEVTRNEDKPWKALNPVNATDLKRIHAWNSHLPEPIDCCVHDVINRFCISASERVAVAAWDGNLSYGELSRRATTISAHLQDLGTRPGTYVMICTGKSLWTVVAMMAVMKAGASFILVDPAQPIARLYQIRDDTKTRLILTLSPLDAVAARLAINVLCVDAKHLLQAPTPTFREPSVSPTDTIYAVFTSGTTGRPKGVVVSHRAFLTSAVINGGAQHIDEKSRVLQLASFTFDASIAEILYPLVHGGSICIPSEDECRKSLEKSMNDYCVTWATLTPSLARTLNPSKLTTLKVLALGGEAVKQIDVEMWADKVWLGNGYGPAESSVDAVVQPKIEVDDDPSLIGRSVAGVSWVVDPDDHAILKPVGSVGELLLEGPTLAAGYLNDPEKTGTAFVGYPEWLARLRGGNQGRLYKTGDLVQYSSNGDGKLRFIGRKDNQVKLRGQRIELGEVEHHLRNTLSDARDIIAEVVTPSDDGSRPVLVAFVVIRDADCFKDDFVLPADPSMLSQFDKSKAVLRTLVPEYMVPNLLIPLARAPLTSNGKIDRRLLRSEMASRSRNELYAYSTLDTAKQPPRTAEEILMQKLVAFILKVEPSQVGMNDLLFQLGADSIAAMQLIWLIQESGFSLLMRDVFGSQNLESLAASLRKQTDVGNMPDQIFVGN